MAAPAAAPAEERRAPPRDVDLLVLQTGTPEQIEEMLTPLTDHSRCFAAQNLAMASEWDVIIRLVRTF